MTTAQQPLKWAILAFALASLAGCGLTGDLKRADPLWGDPQGELEPAELPTRTGGDLPPLPGDEDEDDLSAPPNSDDELLGGLEG